MRTSTSTIRSLPRSTPEAPARPGRPEGARTVILGIDPGTLVTGYGVIELSGGTASLIASGMVRNGSDRPMAERLKVIHESLLLVIRKYRPDQAAVETAFYGKNAQSALKLGQARGVAILAAVSGGLPLAEYSPREIKKAVVGNGNASKQQVQFMIRSLLRMTGAAVPFDVTDALAVAVCHGHRTARGGKRYADWGAFLRENPGKVHRRTAPR
jgi:crossover junction endodeoxyribonuclease RuvC